MLAVIAPIHQPNPHCLYIPICIMLHINNSHLESKHFQLMFDSLRFDVERLISNICFYCHRLVHSYCDIISFSFDWSKSLKSALFESFFYTTTLLTDSVLVCFTPKMQKPMHVNGTRANSGSDASRTEKAG